MRKYHKKVTKVHKVSYFNFEDKNLKYIIRGEKRCFKLLAKWFKKLEEV